MASQQTNIANPAAKTPLPPNTSGISLFPEVNAEAIKQIYAATTTAKMDTIVVEATKKLEEKYGRPLTYAEIRMEMG